MDHGKYVRFQEFTAILNEADKKKDEEDHSLDREIATQLVTEAVAQEIETIQTYAGAIQTLKELQGVEVSAAIARFEEVIRDETEHINEFIDVLASLKTTDPAKLPGNEGGAEPAGPVSQIAQSSPAEEAEFEEVLNA